MTVKVEQLDAGYVVTCPDTGLEAAYSTLDEALSRLLSMFEGRASTGTGTSYGTVTVGRSEPKKALPGLVVG